MNVHMQICMCSHYILILGDLKQKLLKMKRQRTTDTPKHRHTCSVIQLNVLSCACSQTHSQTHVWFGDLLLEMRPWEYLCHHSTQIEAVNRNPGGKERIKKYLLTFPPHHDLGVWRRVVVSTYIYLGCVYL